MRLLLVEDHRAMREMISDYLRSRGYAVDCAADGASALRAFFPFDYDGVVLDLGLPDIDGIDLLKRWRDASPDTPVIILSARDQVADRVGGLDAGADDYILKPFELSELDARLRAILRRPGTRRDPVHRYGGLEFLTSSRCATIEGRLLDLTRREASVLEELMMANGNIVVKDVLEDRVYALDESVGVNALEAAVSRLRRKIAKAGSAIQVEAIRGIGYRLSGGVA